MPDRISEKRGGYLMKILFMYQNLTPDKYLPDEDIEAYKKRLWHQNPKTIKGYAKCLEVTVNTLHHWIKQPSIVNKGKFWKRKQLFLEHYQTATLVA
jgi:hypothetical protein